MGRDEPCRDQQLIPFRPTWPSGDRLNSGKVRRFVPSSALRAIRAVGTRSAAKIADMVSTPADGIDLSSDAVVVGVVGA